MSFGAIISTFIVLMAICIIIAFHEYGHYLAAIKCDVKVEEFSIGFGKTLFSRTDKRGTVWKICAVPMGGYVKMSQEAAAKDKLSPYSFDSKSPWCKILISIAGPFFNYILTFTFATLMIMLVKSPNIKFAADIVKVSSSEIQGINVGDQILRINGSKVGHSKANFQAALSKQLIHEVTVKNSSSGEVVKVSIGNIAETELLVDYIPLFDHHKLSLWQSMTLSFEYLADVTVQSYHSIKKIILGKASLRQLAGVIKIVKTSSDQVDFQGSFGENIANAFLTLLSLVTSLSVAIGFINLVPIPGITDGGQILFHLYEAIAGKSLPEKFKHYTTVVGFLAFIALFAAITFNDILYVFAH